MRGVRRAVRVAGLEGVLPESAAVWLIAVGGLLRVPIHIVGPFRRGSGVPFSWPMPGWSGGRDRPRRWRRLNAAPKQLKLTLEFLLFGLLHLRGTGAGPVRRSGAFPRCVPYRASVCLLVPWFVSCARTM
jgi:hypothetical protein